MSLDFLSASVEPAQLMLVYSAYLLGAASPGPSNLAIMNISMRRGRAAGVVTAFGVLAGSMFWAVIAATGLGAILTSFAYSLTILKLLGGCYLLYLAYRSAKSAFGRQADEPENATVPAQISHFQNFRTGLMMHVGNPKAILTWAATMSLGLSSGSSTTMLGLIIAGCFCIGAIIFTGYALIFSTVSMAGVYARMRRWFESAFAMMFGYAGLRLLLIRSP